MKHQSYGQMTMDVKILPSADETSAIRRRSSDSISFNDLQERRYSSSDDISIPDPLPPCFESAEKIKSGLCVKCGEKIKRKPANKIKRMFLRLSNSSSDPALFSKGGENENHQCSRCINEAGKIASRHALSQDQLDLDFELSIKSYEGSYNKNGEPHGSNCVMTWNSGDVYEGTFVDGTRVGQGSLHFADGSYYYGEWQSDLMHGQGLRRFPNGNTYKGPYQNGKRQGKNGKFEFTNGDTYIGEFAHDKFHGLGTFTYKNGVIFEGNFCEGKRQGKGSYRKPGEYTDFSWYTKDKPIGLGVRWNYDRSMAWRLASGTASKNTIDITEALKIMEEIDLKERVANQ